ncbi:response regulator [Leptolyngbya cf. ectocarpi LEGE 11479]|uniref:histidine kinase n=1 Tax=Leptolyngbya cf. ectocarpi LEGE 11479 TaxID=1828722 RepID=A0A928WYX2_LEPEC|nr:hybrid sensor histidine kinase/response regulator [Leptolyngbya ectocarpi]MBE9065402.1 response regulator [Leptolyngbya cf. ectocarpi LEGE 11479]
MLPEQQQRILGYFIEEAKDHLNTIEQGLLNLQATIGNPEMANEVFRAAHSVKGGAAMLGIESMQRTAHRLEDYFKLLKEAPIQIDRSLESMFLRVFDALQELLEQLQGPFGLTEDKERSIMAGVEPVFQQLQGHLDQLVATADTNDFLEEKAVPVTASNPVPQPIEESALKLVFSSDVSAALREMLARFKQADTEESRAALEDCCQRLERLGEQFNLPTWMSLVKYSRWAVCDRNNDYRTLAPVLIKEIKKAQDLVLAGREPEITISETLHTLAAQGDPANATDDLDALFASNELDSADSALSADIDDLPILEEPDLTVDSSTVDSSIEAAADAAEEGIALDDLLNDAANSPSGPEVGAAELTSLADLFETGGDALDSDWDEEDIPITEAANPVESLDIDIAPDFEDLLSDDSSALGTSPNDFESGNELADLFGDSDTPESDTPESDTPESIDSSASSDIGLGDLTNPVDSAGLDITDLDITDLDIADVDIADLDNTAIAAENAEAREDSILPESLDSIDGLFEDAAPDAASSVDDLFNTSLPEESASGVDDLFNDSLPGEDASTSVDELFGDLDELSEETESNEDLLAGAVESLDELQGLEDPIDNSPASTNADDLEALSDIELGLSVDDAEHGMDALFGGSSEETGVDQATDAVSDGFFDIDTAIPGPSDNSETESGPAEFDDFFTVGESASVAQETESDALENDLWETAETADSSAPASISAPAEATVEGLPDDDLSEDIWGGDNPNNTAGTILETDIPLQESDLGTGLEQSLEDASASLDDSTADDSEDLELDDMWASVEDVSGENLVTEEPSASLDDNTADDSEDLELDDMWASVEDVSGENLVAETDPVASDMFSDMASPETTGLADVFGNDATELDDLTIDLGHQPEAQSSLGAESLDADLDELSSDTVESDSSLDSLFDAAELAAEPGAESDVAALGDLGDLTLDEPEASPLDASGLNIPDLNLTSDTLPGENSLEENSDGLDDAILSTPPANDIDFDLLDLEDGGIVTGFVMDEDDLEPVGGHAAAVAENDNVGNGGDSGDLDLIEEMDEAAEPIASSPLDEAQIGDDIASADSSNDFGDLEALLETPVEVSSPAQPTPPAQDIDDEFGDLEALLQDADQTLAPTSASSSTSYRPPANRLSGRRMITDQTMRVSVNHLDNLSNLVGELVVNRNTLEQDQERLRQFLDNLLFQVQQLNDVGQRMRDLYERSLLESSLISSRQSYHVTAAGVPAETNSELGDHATGESFDALEMDRFTGFHTLSQEMIELIVRVRESASDIAYTVESSDQVTRQFRQVTNQLQEGLNKARMVQFAQTAARLPRAVRDISLKCGKEARLVVEGRDILIDKMILEQLYDPMTHLVNNAITHGVETPEERRQAGKTPEGVITIRAFYQGNQTVISVGDDGAGINPDVVKQKALQKGLISQADVQTMTVLDVYDLLFHPGFSTRDQADDFAGRGFGMDVVRTSLADIRGNITIDSELGRGTNFTIRLPLTLSISKALSCISNQARIAFPMDGVEDMFDVSRERIQQNDQEQDCILWRDTLLPFQNLSDLLSFNRTLGRGRVYGGNQDENMISIVVLRSTNSFIALEVDQVMGEQEIVIKQLEGPVPKPTGIAGATVLGDGRVMPIADVLELIDLAMGRVRREPNAAVWTQSDDAPPEEISKVKSEPTVLIVDDSITVRELLSMSFNKVGYRVEQARDGQEAWEKLRSGLPCDLVFCDIEMPRMDGLELLSRLQKDDGLQQIPIAMLTSRGADRHRQMAVELGASGYFTKPYLEEALLDAAQKMLHGDKLV